VYKLMSWFELFVIIVNSNRRCERDAVYSTGSDGTGRPVCRCVRRVTYHRRKETCCRFSSLY